MVKGKLTAKQKAFVREYRINGGNATQAAIKAGYSKKSAYAIGEENLRKPEIRAALGVEEAKAREKYEYSLDTMVRELDEVKAAADAEGNRNAQLKAIELKGKAFGLFVDKVKNEVTLTQACVHFVDVENSEDNDSASIN